MSAPINYRTFDELLAAVRSDLRTYDKEGFIDPQDLIKVAQRVNKDLSVKIHSVREEIVSIEKGRVCLPEDFYMLNFAILCVKGAISEPVIQGHQREQITTDKCDKRAVRLTPCGKGVQIVQHFNTATYTYKHFAPLRLQDSNVITKGCYNTTCSSEYTGYIKNGWLYTSLDAAQLYLNYTGSMVNEDGELLVLDHDIVNEYYEYALKERILENMLMNGEQVSEQRSLMGEKRRISRIEAKTLVGMPDFKDLQNIWEMNRKAQYQKYYSMFTNVEYV